MENIIKLSSPATRDFWKITVLYEDDHLLALEKPSGLLTSPDRYDPDRPNLMKLLHRDIERGAPWVRERRVDYLANAHRLDFETSGIILLAKSKPVLVALADQFGSEKPLKKYVTLVQGNPPEDQFTVDFKLAPHPVKVGLMRVDEKRGKKSRTDFEVLERYSRHALMLCLPATGRTHQIRVHLQRKHLPIVADSLYGGKPLLLSSLKPGFRLKPKQVENPLMSRVALHASELTVTHPVTGEPVTITCPWPKDFSVAVKYLRKYAGAGTAAASLAETSEE